MTNMEAYMNNIEVEIESSNEVCFTNTIKIKKNLFVIGLSRNSKIILVKKRIILVVDRLLSFETVSLNLGEKLSENTNFLS